MTCIPATCPNGKCNQTGECVEANKPSAASPKYCTAYGVTFCKGNSNRCALCPDIPYPQAKDVKVKGPDGTIISLDTLLAGVTEANLHPEVAVSPPSNEYREIIRKHLEIAERHAPARLIDTDSATRKTYPMARGLLDYFPDACAEVAKVSYVGNEKHNPGEEMHHARGKSTDHADCILRHLVGRGGFDGDTRHSAALAWRALALLQEELEREKGLSLPRGARAA